VLVNIRTLILHAGLLVASATFPIAAQVLPPGLEPPADATEAFVIWPEGPPGTVVSGEPEQTTTFRPDPSVEIVRNVEVPTLTVFLPEPGEGNGPAVIVAPGGGGIMLDMTGARDVARWLRDQGVAAFLLQYRLPQTPRDDDTFFAELNRMVGMAGWDGPASEDARQAIRVLRSDPARWGIDPAKIGVIGFSAGARVAILSAIRYDAESRPDFVAPLYAPYPEDVSVPADAPPMFMAFAVDDPFMDGDPFDPLWVFRAWRDAQRPVEMHAYERGGHGFHAEPQGTTSDGWTSAFVRWMRSHQLMPG
jgi:acetyl esterase/lipase